MKAIRDDAVGGMMDREESPKKLREEVASPGEVKQEGRETMKISQKRTCGIYMPRGCLAIEGYGEYRKWCTLGFKTEVKQNPFDMIPLEPCPKPMTCGEFIIAKDDFRKKIYLPPF